MANGKMTNGKVKKQAEALGKVGAQAKPPKSYKPDSPFRKTKQLTSKNGKVAPIE